MKCQICSEEVSNTSYDKPIVLEDGVVHTSCHTSQKLESLTAQFPHANKHTLTTVNIDSFIKHKYCIETEAMDLDSTCGGAYIEYEYFNLESELNDFLRDEIFDNSQYTHKVVVGFHIDQVKTDFEYTVFHGEIEDTEAYGFLSEELKDLQHNGASEILTEDSINTAIWAMDTCKVQELLNVILNSHHYNHLNFNDKKG